MNKVDTTLKNGKIYTAGGWVEGGLAIADGKIVAMGKKSTLPDADEVIDCNGLIVIPGVIDGHVHTNEPWELKEHDGTPAPRHFIDSIESVTAAAAMGGITMMGEHPFSNPWPVTAKLLNEKNALWAPKAMIDYFFHAFASNEGGQIHPDDMKDAWSAGAVSFKVFMQIGPPDHPCGFQDEHLLDAFEVAAKIDALMMMHAENQELIAAKTKKLENRTDFQVHYESRPPFTEFEAVKRCVLFLKEKRTRGLVCHVSIPEGVQEIYAAQQHGFPIYTESCPHYLTMTTKDIDKLGPWMKCAPPLRDPARVAELWNLLNKGYIDVMGSDHCPIPKETKEKGLQNMWDASFGLSGIEHMLPQMLNAVNQGKTTLEQLIRVLCENPAKIYRLPHKGFLAIGADADLVIIDMKHEEKITADNIITACQWTPLEGKTLTGWPTRTLVRGKTVMQDREIIGRPGQGKFISRIM